MRGTAAIAALLLGGCQDRAEPEPAGNRLAPPPPVEAPPLANVAAPNAAQPAAAARPLSATGYALNGTEPFWGGSVTGTGIRYMTPENQFGDEVETEVAYAPGRETYSGRLRGRPFVLTLSAGPCSNGMSDHRYAFTAELQVLGETRRGCADPQ